MAEKEGYRAKRSKVRKKMRVDCFVLCWLANYYSANNIGYLLCLIIVQKIKVLLVLIMKTNIITNKRGEKQHKEDNTKIKPLVTATAHYQKTRSELVDRVEKS
jgi:hypothetical protein